jgi:hypothetical protein
MIFVINPYQFVQGVPQLLNEQFETGATDWTSTVGGFFVAWSPTYQPALLGTYSCRMDTTGASTANAYKNFTPSGSVYCRFQIKNKRVAAQNSNLVTFQTSTGTVLATFQLATSTSRARISVLGGSLASGTQSPVLETDYWAFFEYEKSTGANNAVCRAGFSATSFRPTSWTGLAAATTNGTTTLDAGRIMFGTPLAATNYDVVIDNIQVQATPFPTS